MIKSLSDLEVFQASYQFAMNIFQITRGFVKEEKFSLTDQIVRSSRSVAANIAEGWGRRVYENEFKKHLVYAMGSLEETKVWLLFAKDCQYLSETEYNSLYSESDILGGKIYRLAEKWKTY